MITNYEIVDRVLEALDKATEMAVLHCEAAVASHSLTSDVDLCVADDPVTLMSRVAYDMRSHGMYLVMIFPYDRCSAAFFFCDADGKTGAQIDLVCDPRGVNKYGVRTEALLARRCSGVRWPRIDPLDEALYTLRKRQVKRDRRRFDEARAEVAALGAEFARERTRDIFSSRARAGITGALDDRRPRLARTNGVWRSRLRRPGRLRHRCGFWAHVSSASGQNLSSVAHRFDRFLISAEAVEEPTVLRVLSNAWRPRLLLSPRRTGRWPAPDAHLVIAPLESEDSFARGLVLAMHERVLARLSNRDAIGIAT
jgi:hypothetical protein